MDDTTFNKMFSRWNQALANGEITDIDNTTEMWYGELVMTHEDGIDYITAPIQKYDEEGYIDFVVNVSIPFEI